MIGRPTVMTPETLDMLRGAFLMGCSDREACLYAGIGLQTLYDYQKENPDYSEQKDQFKLNPILKAKKTIFDALEKGDVKVALWYLERKARDEFGNTIKINTPVDIGYELGKLEKTNYADYADKLATQADNS